MNIVDLLLIIALMHAINRGYIKGFLNEAYDLGTLIIAALLAYLLKDYTCDLILNSYNFREMLNINITEELYNVFMTSIKPIIGFTVTFLVAFLLIKLIIYILIKMEKIPKRIYKLEWLGSTIAGLKTVFFFTIVAFFLSFSFLKGYEPLYEDSLFLKPLLKLNYPLYTMQTNIVSLYDDVKELTELMKNQEETLKNHEELVAVLKSVVDNPMITDEYIIEVSKAIVKNKKVIDLTDTDINEVRTDLQQNENYEFLRILYEEEVVTDDLAVKILEANNVIGISEDDIKNIFK